MDSVIGAVIALSLPVVLHYTFLWGEALLEPVKSHLPRIDALYNERPLIVSLTSGVFFAGATLAQPDSAAFYGFAAVGLVLLIFDGIACSISVMRHLRKKRRR